MKMDTGGNSEKFLKGCRVRWFWRHQNAIGGDEKWEMGSLINAKARCVTSPR